MGSRVECRYLLFLEGDVPNRLRLREQWIEAQDLGFRELGLQLREQLQVGVREPDDNDVVLR